ncbi:MAG: ATP-dependent helicase HrpB [Planctomycetota bacterium]|nr:MAG: ATP-dependent helicase HrpB [Planctomycetota bacterium]
MLSSLPIDQVLPELTAALQSANCVVLRAPAGAGKTTRVPSALLAAGLAPAGQIVMLEPRRIAARTAARRMAFECGERVGQSVGYRVRFEESVSRDTQILVVTEGVLLRRLQDDPFLDGIDVVIFDEFHERRLDSDLALAMVRRVQQTVRPELKIVVMSATLDPTKIAEYLGNCPIVESEGRLYPVRIEYLRRVERQQVWELAISGIETVLQQTEGDVLVFLPGVGEIMRTRAELEPLARRHSLEVFTLFGDMTPEDQDRVLSPCDKRKVVLSTNVAETSVTIEGVTAVVDTGLARQMQFDADIGLDRLELTPVSKASTDQRAGRAGRTQPGVCLRLWEEASHRRRPDFDAAELHRVDLSSAVLRLYAWGESDIAAFPWFEAPPASSVEHAVKLLRLLGAIDDAGVTALGKALVRFPVSPRIGRLLVEAHRLGQPDRAALMAAMLSERDPFLRGSSSDRGQRNAPMRTTAIHRSRSDVLDRLHAVEDFLQTGRPDSLCGEINRNAVRTLTQVAKQLASSLRDESGSMRVGLRPVPAPSPPPGEKVAARPDEGASRAPASIDPDEALLRALVAGFPDRVAKRRDSTGDKGLMVGGRGVRLGPRSAVQNSPLFLCVDIDGAGTDAMVRQASEVLREWLPQASVRSGEELFFHPTQKQVVARRRVAFDDLILEETPTSITDRAAAAEVLFEAARSQLSVVMPSDDDGFSGFLARVRCLKQWMPDLPLPAFDDQTMLDVLRDLCSGRRSFADLKSAPWLSTLQSRMDYALVQTIEREAPERIMVPTGSRMKLTYEEGRSPVLAVRIQEVFGMKQTPRIAGGRIPVLLHLLAPNMRPQQITEDLASFWANTYQDVRKELKRRYPKHSWPEDPLTAPPIKKGPSS